MGARYNENNAERVYSTWKKTYVEERHLNVKGDTVWVGPKDV